MPPAAGRTHVVAMWDGGVSVTDLPRSGRLTVGRSQDCDITVQHRSVSRDHAVLHCADRIEVEDLGSTNGTLVGGASARAGTRVPVNPGTIIGVGAALLVVQSGSGSSATTPRRDAPLTRPVEARPIVASPTMRELYRVVDLVARTDLSVLLIGETGTGKDLVAGEIHRRSTRAAGPYIRVNCPAVPDQLFESELFGHERGAFTGAVQSKIGLFEAADGGSLFLDEISDLPLPTQSKLLRALENREITRVGATEPRRVDVRIISATSGSLERLVLDGTFRADLYFRLDGMSLTVPPLRERSDEVGPLARSFLRDFCARKGMPPGELSGEVLGWLERYPWPGNVRELKNAVERAATLCASSVIDLSHFDLDRRSTAWSMQPWDRTKVTAIVPDGLGRRDPRPPARDISGNLHSETREAVRDFEQLRIHQAMDQCAGNQTRAARLLGISRRTLVTRLTEYGFARPVKKLRTPPA